MLKVRRPLGIGCTYDAKVWDVECRVEGSGLYACHARGSRESFLDVILSLTWDKGLGDTGRGVA